jgi:uncharacterized protein (UPF0332 family)
MVELSMDEKIALSNTRFEKSREMLSDSLTALRTGMFKTSINRSYYAVLHAARSLLILKGIDPVRHDTVKTMLSLHFIKPKLLPQDTIKIFKNLLSLRTDVDYGDFETVARNDAREAINQAKLFLKQIQITRKKLLKELFY